MYAYRRLVNIYTFIELDRQTHDRAQWTRSQALMYATAILGADLVPCGEAFINQPNVSISTFTHDRQFTAMQDRNAFLPGGCNETGHVDHVDHHLLVQICDGSLATGPYYLDVYGIDHGYLGHRHIPTPHLGSTTVHAMARHAWTDAFWTDPEVRNDDGSYTLILEVLPRPDQHLRIVLIDVP